MSQLQNVQSHQDALVSDEKENEYEIDLIGVVQTLGEEKWLLLGLPFICACVAAVISLNLTPMYTAKATFVMPDKQLNSTSVVLDQLGGLGGLAGSLTRSPIEMYVVFMKSNMVQDSIISEFDLMRRYQTKSQEDVRKKLLSQVQITVDKRSGLIVIEAQDESPDIAAKLANAYLKPFREVLNRMSLEEAHQRREFFSQQIGAIAHRPFRDPFVQSTLMNSMIKQYEAARIDEARESHVLFTVDIANIPERRSSPKRIQLVLIVGLASFFLTILLILLKRVLRHVQTDPALLPKWETMKHAWKLRR